jgi:aspartate/methionine/tyrosine aminotransferase
VINYPGNPTGMNYSDNELKELAKVLDRENTIV